MSADGESESDHQVWIAGGIGITPFLARLGELSKAGQPIPANADLFYCTPDEKAGDFPGRLEELCHATGVRLHLRLTQRDGPLKAQEIASMLRAKSTVWFCGPSRWGRSLGKTLIENGLPATAFHQEAFEFR